MKGRWAVYAEALRQNGRGVQLAKLYEELGELMVAVGHHSEGRVGVEKVTEEVADVRIMLEQLEGILGIPAGDVEKEMQRKLNRLRARLGMAKACACSTPVVCEETGLCMYCQGEVS